MALKTFDEWSALGYRVKKGAKAVGRNKQGVPVFHLTQVWDPNDVGYRGRTARGNNWNDSGMNDWYDCGDWDLWGYGDS